MSTPADRSAVPRRALCQEIANASWYTDAVLTQNGFDDCIMSRPEIKPLVRAVLDYEDIVFDNPNERVYQEMRVILGAKPVTDIEKYFSKDSVSSRGRAWTNVHRLFLYYRLFDRIWLYHSSQPFNVVSHAKTLQESSFKSWSFIENLQKFLKHRQFLAHNNGNKTYGPRLSPGNGVLQQLKDLVALGKAGVMSKIHLNILMAALSINALSGENNENIHSHPGTGLRSEKESIVDIVSHTQSLNVLTPYEGDFLCDMFKGEDDGQSISSTVHRTLHIALGVSPLFLISSYALNTQHWSIADIYKESQQLGNWRSNLLVKIEKTILDNIFNVANGLMDPSQALTAIVQDLPWEEINNMSPDDPSNTRFKAVGSVAGLPTNAIRPALSLTTNVDKGKGRDMTSYPSDEDDGAMNIDGWAADNVQMATNFDIHQMDNNNTDNRMDVDPLDMRDAPIVSSRTPSTSRQRSNVSSTSLQSTSSGKQKKTKKNRRQNKPSSLGELTVHNTPFPTDITKMRPVINPKIGNYIVQELPARTLFCAKGTPYDIVFRIHGQSMTDFWRKHLGLIERDYINKLAPHVVNKAWSTFNIVSYSDMQSMSATDKLQMLRRGPILETDRPIAPMSFDRKGMKSFGFSLSDVVPIQTQSRPKSAGVLLRGTLEMMLESKPGSALNALNLPMPGGIQSAGNLSSDSVAWQEAVHSRQSVQRYFYPGETMRWGLCATSCASHEFHTDSDGFCTYVDVMTGIKVWVVMRPSNGNLDDFSEFGEINRYIGRSFDKFNICDNSRIEAVVLTPGTRLYMRPNTMHAVYTAENSICHGGHFYATSTLKDTLCGIIQAFVGYHNVTNNDDHLESRFLLRQMIIFFFEGLEQSRFEPDDPAWEHLPRLNPHVLDDAGVNTMHAVEEFFAACSLGVFSNVLDSRTYWYPNLAFNEAPNKRQRQEMEYYDRNAMSLEDRNACAQTRGLAYKLLEWFTEHYAFVPLKGQTPVKCGQFLEQKLAEQAYAIYVAKVQAVGRNFMGARDCSLVAVKRQLQGVFETTTYAYETLEHLFEQNTSPQYVHADFSDWGIKPIQRTTEYVPADLGVGVCQKRTSLDLKFEEGFKVNFDPRAHI